MIKFEENQTLRFGGALSSLYL